MRTVNFAVVGCGRVASMHFDAIKKAPHANLTAVCDIDETAAKNAAEENGLSRYYTDIDKMLKEEDIDVVNVCTPSGIHSDIAVKVAEHGINVLCEKPLDVTKENINRMIDVCKKNNVLLSGVFQRRNTEVVQIAKKLVEKGHLGKLILCDAYLKYNRTQEYYDSGDWRGTWELDGGGCLMNQGIHGVDMLIHMAGRIKSVVAKCKTLARRIEVEDTACVLVNFESGAMGVIECSTSISPGQDTLFAIHGDKGSISFGNYGFYTWQLEDGNVAPEIHDNMGGINCEWAGDSLHSILIEDMANAVLEGRQPMIPGSEARHAVDVILAIYESSATGKEVMIG